MSTTFQHLSVLGTNLLEPAFDLINRLQASRPAPPNKMQSSIIEHSYSASIILLIVTAIESSIRRLQYFKKDKTWAVLDYALNVYSDYPDLNHLVEVFTVRDSIAHNYLWKTNVSFLSPHEVHVKRITKRRKVGTNRFSVVLNPRTKKTKSLRLNLRPTSLSRSDVSIVLEVAQRFLTYLEDKDPAKAQVISGRYFLLGQETLLLKDAVGFINERWRTA